MNLPIVGDIFTDYAGYSYAAIFIGIFTIVLGLYLYNLFNRMHPKKRFEIMTRRGKRSIFFRCYNNAIPVFGLNLFDLILLRDPPSGVPLENFRTVPWADVDAPVYSAIVIDTDILPTEMPTGTEGFILMRCSKKECDYVKRWHDPAVFKKNGAGAFLCPACENEVIRESITVSSEHLHLVKTMAIEENRFLLKMMQDTPISFDKFIQDWRIGGKLYAIRTECKRFSREMVDKNNPILTNLTFFIPLGIGIFILGLAGAAIYAGIGDQIMKATAQMHETALLLREIADKLPR